jgi:hypothetical protein
MTRFLTKEERITKLEQIRLALGIKKRNKVTGNFE